MKLIRHTAILFALCRICLGALPTAALAIEPVDYVDTLIGTGNGGNTFPGPCLPFGFVKLSPDTDIKRAGGYDANGKIRHFSHNHISGMGGPKYGNVGLMPIVGAVDSSRLGHLSAKADEIGRAGYYHVLLSDYDIGVELTATMHAGMHCERRRERSPILAV
jgi:putative alpha-1,2-mannosidase